MTRYVAAAALALGTWTVVACSSGADGAAAPGSPDGDAGALTDAAGDTANTGDDASPDGAPLAPPSEQAGSRLTPSYRTTRSSDGASFQMFIAWKDTSRNEHCYPQRLSDGKLHCTPLGRSVDYEATDTYFLDAQCATPVAGIRKAAPSCAGGWSGTSANNYVTRYDQNPQCSAVRVYLPPSTSPVAPTTIYAKNGSSCTAQSASYLTTDWDLYPKSALASLTEVAPSALVEMTRTEETTIQPSDRVTVGSRVHPVIVRMSGTDGSFNRGVQQLVDYTRSEFCSPAATLSDGKLHCAPSGSWFYDGASYVDSSCTTPAVEVSIPQQSACERDDRNGKYLMSRENVRGCMVEQLFPFPTEPPHPDRYYKSGNQCLSTGSSGTSYQAYTKTAMTEIPPSTFVEFTATYVTGSNARSKAGTRLAPMSLSYAGVDGFSWMADTMLFQDKQAQTTCREALLTDGQLHCVPSFTWLQLDVDSNYYADASCMQSVVAVPKIGTCAFPGPRPTLIAKSLQLNGCSGVKLFPLPTSSPLTLSAVYVKNGTSCTQETSNGPNYLQNNDFYPASIVQVPNVDPSTLPTLTVTMSP